MTTPDTSTAQLADLFFRLGKRIRHRSAEHLAPVGLTPAQARALRVIAHSDHPLRIAALAGRLDIVPRSATTVVDALAEQGLVARTPDPADRRSVLVSLTPAGSDLIERLHDTRRQVAEDLFLALSADDRAELTRLLTALDAASDR